MPDRHSFGEIHLDVTAGRERVQAKPGSETPFRIAILGDFSGRGNRQLIEIGEAMANRRPTLIDRDNFDSVFAKMSPHLDLLMGGKDGYPITLKFTDLEEFHPDSLFRQVQLFQKLRDTREKLSDPKTFAADRGRTRHKRDPARGGCAGPSGASQGIRVPTCSKPFPEASWTKCWRRRKRKWTSRALPAYPTPGPPWSAELLLRTLSPRLIPGRPRRWD